MSAKGRTGALGVKGSVVRRAAVAHGEKAARRREAIFLPLVLFFFFGAFAGVWNARARPGRLSRT